MAKAVNFKLSVTVLSCLFDITDKKRKIANTFQNKSYENKLSKVVKPIERQVINALKDIK